MNRWRACRALPVLTVALACAAPRPEAPVVQLTERRDPYLVAPLEGYPLTAEPALVERVEEAHARLLRGVALVSVEAAARELQAEDPGFQPAAVLFAEVVYLRADAATAVDLMRPIVDELPDYTAARLVLARASEVAGDLPAALESFARLAGTASSGAVRSLAAERVEEIAPRAGEIVFNRLRDELGRGRVEGAEEHLAWLEEWLPESPETLEGGRVVAVEKGDLESELAAIRRLSAAGAAYVSQRELRQREGELEARIGDVRLGLEKLEALAEEYPRDPGIAESLDLAKFLWRLQLQPKEVQDIGRKGELDRSDLATLLYWYFPRVRYSEISNPPIATDILDHPRRDVILRVLNLHLMEVDETLHRFEPATPATRVTAFRALLELLRSSPRGLSCLSDAGALEVDPGWRSVCGQTARCRLIPEAADCRPAASISGSEVLELLRHTLDLLG